MIAQSSLRDIFNQGLDKLGLNIPSDKINLLEQYQNLLSKWNKTINLSAHRSDKDSIEKNFLDSITLSQLVSERVVFDFGSGAGFPGLVIAILNPQSKVYLLEADQKKVSFLKTVILSLPVKNAEVIHDYVRLENISLSEKIPSNIDLIVSRATISPQILIKFSSLTLKKDGRLALMLSEKQMLDFQSTSSELFEIEINKKYTLPWSKINHFLIFLRKK